MTNKKLVLLIITLLTSSFSIANSKVDTLALSKQVIPLDDANPQPLLILAAKHGQARGVVTGKAAEDIKKKTGRDIQVRILATRLDQLNNGCSKVRLEYMSNVPAASGRLPKMDIQVCPNAGK